ncbi:hypothetical protein DK880_00443 [Candidatus Cardinium hertigii]|uniref:Uncharacterized protein n=1 Tax=Candidatus Cardinium hertigii TaxID=247481 RepID=A0A2Z3L8P0_9BACT|nr:hypothetical protein DK880_00443 [Candidatus Cardinium hertigii]
MKQYLPWVSIRKKSIPLQKGTPHIRIAPYLLSNILSYIRENKRNKSNEDDE